MFYLDKKNLHNFILNKFYLHFYIIYVSDKILIF